MKPLPATPPKPLSEGQRTALLSLLTDEDPQIRHVVREKLFTYGPEARTWLRPRLRAAEPGLRRRLEEVIVHFDRQDADIRFLGFCLKHGEEFDLEEAAWLLARTRYPEISVTGYQAILDSWADDLRDRLPFAKGEHTMLRAISDFLFQELGFAGNEAHYYEPENSYFNKVLDQRKGIPITLSLLYLLVARRLALPVVGVALPGHFVCRHQSPAGTIFIDAFNGGRLLTKPECLRLLSRSGLGVELTDFSPSSARRILARMCANLHQIHHEQGNQEEMARFQRYLIALAR